MNDLLAVALGATVGASVMAGVARRRPRQGVVVTAPARSDDGLEVVPRHRLPTFANVGGLDELKQELRETIGLVLQHPEHAERFRITWNGLLLHGPPGSGKTFFVRALAGELGLNFVPISTSDLVSQVPGAGADDVEAAFRFASTHLPCLLFFDEFDAVARDRQQDGAGRDVLTQLLHSVEAWRHEPRLVVAAATNDLDAIDAAAIRPGRFDRHVRLDLPDEAARRAIFWVTLAGRPHVADLPWDDLARRTRGRSAAGIAQVCEAAALAAFRESIGTDTQKRITAAHLFDALDNLGGNDRPTVEEWNWDMLVLAPETLAQLRQIEAFLTDPDLAYRHGIEPPNGVLLTGPPGTGKTTVAKVLAAEAKCSFYPASAAELSSRWLGESEKAIAALFRRARAHAPSIVFLDEIDAIGATRGAWGAYDRQLDQLLQEIDGMRSQPGVMLLGATNRPDALDPALLRGGRLSTVIELPLPDRDARRRLLDLHCGRMPLADVDLDELADGTDGFSGADLKALCQQAAVQSMVRDPADISVNPQDFERALAAGRTRQGLGDDRSTRRRRSRPLKADSAT